MSIGNKILRKDKRSIEPLPVVPQADVTVKDVEEAHKRASEY
jgi:hypothetical protein